MGKSSRSLGLTAAAFASAVGLYLTSSGCRPLQVKADKPKGSGACPPGLVMANGFCVKDGAVFLLHMAANAVTQAGSTTNTISFGKQELFRGDKIFAYGRFSYPKSGSGSSVSLGFRLGSNAIGATSTQYVGDQDAGTVLARHALAYEVPDNTDAPMSLVASAGAAATSSGSDGGLLVFRATQLSDVLKSNHLIDGAPPYFATDAMDSDKLNIQDLTPASSGSSIISISSTGGKASDLALMRAGVSWEIAPGKTNVCEGVSLTWQFLDSGKEVFKEGPYVVGANQSMGSTAMQFLHRDLIDGPSRQLSLSVKIDTGGRTDKASCVIKVTEPSTLSALIFRPVAQLQAEIQNARYLHDLGSAVIVAGRFATNPSSPPIENIHQYNWDHLRSDVLLMDVGVNLAAEDRVKPTRAFLQLSRAPDGLSSHLSKSILKSPDRPRNLTITDMAIENDVSALTRFYLTGMGFQDDAKPVMVKEGQMNFMHFRRIGDHL